MVKFNVDITITIILVFLVAQKKKKKRKKSECTTKEFLWFFSLSFVVRNEGRFCSRWQKKWQITVLLKVFIYHDRKNVWTETHWDIITILQWSSLEWRIFSFFFLSFWIRHDELHLSDSNAPESWFFVLILPFSQFRSLRLKTTHIFHQEFNKTTFVCIYIR